MIASYCLQAHGQIYVSVNINSHFDLSPFRQDIMPSKFAVLKYWCSLARLLLSTTILLLAGCSTLEPVELTDEYSMAPAQSELWLQLADVRSDDWLHLLNTGDEAIDWRLRLIDSASQSLDLQTFLWKDDETGLMILRHIYEAADRGVRVRILLDDTFTATHDEAIWEIDHHPNIEFRIYNPFASRNSSMLVRQLLNLGDFSRVDHRMHNKVMVVDNHAAIVGGRNLADEYFGSHDVANFRDMEVLTAGQAVLSLSQQFDDYWNSNWSFPVDRIISVEPALSPEQFEAWILVTAKRGLDEQPATRTQRWIQTAQTAVAGELLVLGDAPASDDPAAAEELPTQLSKVLIEQMEAANEELLLVSAYLIPTAELEQAIERAEDRGVRVRVLTNSLRSNNHVAAHSAYRDHIHQLLDHGAEVHEVRVFAKDRALYMDHPVGDKHLGLHSKLLLIDNHLSYIGSANLDPRSLRLNTEMGLLINSSEFNQLLREVVALDFHQRNAWHLQKQDDGSLHWVADDTVLDTQPAESSLQRLEDWFLSILPIEDEM
jgi:putative cardiolipin synthase